MRNAFFDELVKLAHRHDNLALVTGDLGFGVIEQFAETFPDRFINAGVAEQNMTGLAAGMASEGYHVFTYSIANFPTFRCAEQIRNDVAYHDLPVTVVVVGGGLSYGNLGYSHHAVQDYALIRTMPGMRIAAPGDPLETRAALRHLVANPGPSFLRLGKAGEPTWHTDVPDVAPGAWLPVAGGDPGGDVLVTTGAALQIAMQRHHAADVGAKPTVFSVPLWGMDVKPAQVAQAARFDEIHTIEDHLVDGGFGSWMIEALNAARATTAVRIEALDPVVTGSVGSQETLNELGGLRA
jgi:transketolase